MKKQIKKAIFILVSSLIIYFPILLFILYKIKFVKFKTIVHLISIIPSYFGEVIRNLFYRMTLKKVGLNFRIDFGSYIAYDDVKIGNNVVIEEYCVISHCEIGDDVIIAANVSLMSGANHHGVDNLEKTFLQQPGKTKTIKLGNNLWIGTHAVVMNDISDGTVIGASSLVNKVFPPNSIIAGNPAKIIRMRGKDVL